MYCDHSSIDTASLPPQLTMVAGTDATSSKRGTIIAVGGIDVPVTYWHACTFQPPHVRLTMTYLRRRYDLPIDDLVAGGIYKRHCGDAGDRGRGEILEWAER